MRNILINNGKSNELYDFIAKDMIFIPYQDIVDVQDFLDVNISIKDEYVVYIPTTRRSESAFSYTGVELALWVYMHMILQQNVRFHIVLLGTETKGAFFEHCKYANLVLAPNVHYVQNSKHDIEYFLENTVLTNYASKDCLVEFLKAVNVKPPVAFKNAHTITNEWCISRWRKALGIALPSTAIEKSLYFTYLNTVLSISEVPTIRNTYVPTKKVLVVDDDIDNGWESFFEALLPNNVKCIGSDFKKAKTRDEIVNEVETIVKETDPDVIILDLRLHDSDHNNNVSMENLTGIKVLRKVKKINKGIQVIGFTASNKVWNLLSWQESGIDSFIIKESPTKSGEPGYTQKSIKQLLDAIGKADKKASYLKRIYDGNHVAMNKLRNLKKNRLIDKTMGESIISYLTLAESSLFAVKANHDTAFMYYFLILEALAKQMIDDNGVLGLDKLYYFQFRRDETYLMIFNETTGEKTKDKLYCGKATENQHIRIPYNQKFYNMIDYANIPDVNPVSIVKKRNIFNHPDCINSKPIRLKDSDVEEIMNIVCSLINNYR